MFIGLLFFLFSVISGIGTCFLWGKIGGDEEFGKRHPKTKKILHLIHHWWMGLAMIIAVLLSPIIISYVSLFLSGFGFGLFLDDGLFHSFESYFQRKSP